MMSLWDALRMNMMISYQELVRTFPSSEELLSDNTLEKDENSPDNGFEVGEYNTYEAYNSEKQYFTREDYTYDYDLLNAI
ncbi:hypothetical protein EO769_03070 [Escherichia coli]|nr:hypothetical protein EO769_03070 [Escherichia coli]